LSKINSAKKRHRQSEVRRLRNKAIRTYVRNRITELRQYILQSKADSPEKLREVMSAIDRAVAKGVMTKNAASRRKSRLARAMVKTLKEASAKAQQS